MALDINVESTHCRLWCGWAGPARPRQAQPRDQEDHVLGNSEGGCVATAVAHDGGIDGIGRQLQAQQQQPQRQVPLAVAFAQPLSNQECNDAAVAKCDAGRADDAIDGGKGAEQRCARQTRMPRGVAQPNCSWPRC